MIVEVVPWRSPLRGGESLLFPPFPGQPIVRDRTRRTSRLLRRRLPSPVAARRCAHPWRSIIGRAARGRADWVIFDELAKRDLGVLDHAVTGPFG